MAKKQTHRPQRRRPVVDPNSNPLAIQVGYLIPIPYILSKTGTIFPNSVYWTLAAPPNASMQNPRIVLPRGVFFGDAVPPAGTFDLPIHPDTGRTDIITLDPNAPSVFYPGVQWSYKYDSVFDLSAFSGGGIIIEP